MLLQLHPFLGFNYLMKQLLLFLYQRNISAVKMGPHTQAALYCGYGDFEARTAKNLLMEDNSLATLRSHQRKLDSHHHKCSG